MNFAYGFDANNRLIGEVSLGSDYATATRIPMNAERLYYTGAAAAGLISSTFVSRKRRASKYDYDAALPVEQDAEDAVAHPAPDTARITLQPDPTPAPIRLPPAQKRQPARRPRWRRHRYTLRRMRGMRKRRMRRRRY